MLCGKGCYTSANSFDPCQPVRCAQADMNRNCLLHVYVGFFFVCQSAVLLYISYVVLADECYGFIIMR